MSPLQLRKQAGFTLMEVMIAVVILIVGMMALALLMTRMYATSNRSHFMNLAATFAAEKMEDLEHYAPSDANIAAGGSVDPSNPVNGYYDVVGMAMSNGTYEEVLVKGASSYQVFTLNANGSQPTTTTTTTYTSSGMTFRRQWLIEYNTPANGVARLTVFVTLLDLSVQPPVTFQMSAVRPCLVGGGGTTC